MNIDRTKLIDDVKATWVSLLAKYFESGDARSREWVDEKNPDPNAQMTCEALESFFIPALACVELEEHLNQINKDHPKLFNKSLENAINMCKSQGGFFPGSYLIGNFVRDDGGKRTKQSEQVIDVAFFLATSILHYKKLFQLEFEEKPAFQELADEWLNKSLEAMTKAHVKNQGWSWSPDHNNYSMTYFTYTAIETIEEIIRFENLLPPESREHAEVLREQVRQATQYLLKKHIKVDRDNAMSISNKIDFSSVTTSGDASWYYNLWIIVALSIASQLNPIDEDSQQALMDAISGFVDKLGPREEAYVDLFEANSFYLDSDAYLPRDGAAQWRDRAGLPLAFKTLLIAKRSSDDDVIGSLWSELTERRTCLDNPHLWDDDSYSIYYTERMIEAYARLLKQQPVKTSGLEVDARIRLSLADVVRTLGLSEMQKEIADLKTRIELLEKVSSRKTPNNAKAAFEKAKEKQEQAEQLRQLEKLRNSLDERAKNDLGEKIDQLSNDENLPVADKVRQIKSLVDEYEQLRPRPS